ncbi:site-specific tyrosine recombinase/integron integrase [Lactobacillus sp. ESL0681]|uniref:site-specific tyrosine recombinase/integron integrase n=1 Tax=Lactobacillus sp. ESL0681 TaxID=2983211 RepID=UPI0023F6C372|nr:site-specific tyrosine recombinase/integron integrase [Lactobacillus sp. ESL0681]WEV40698.1 tyrosine-type recombinase/integrase [Lactobacillus sp. ESL0681]
MSKNIINQILQEMLKVLDNQQLIILRKCLYRNLSTEYENKADEVTNEVLLKKYFSAKRTEGCSEKSLTYYRKTIVKMLTSIELIATKITTDDLRSYLTNYQMEHNSSKITIDNIRRILSSFFNWLEDEDYIVKSPVRRIHKIKTTTLVKETYTDEELEKLRDNCTKIRDLAMIDLLASTGMRVGELVGLNRNDIDFSERECVVLGKGDKERVTYFDARAKLHLKNYLLTRQDSNAALFVGLRKPKMRLTIGGVESCLKRLGYKAEIGNVYPHKFRRTLATIAIDKGMPIEQLQKLLGHKRIDTTLHYAMVKQQNVKLAHRKYIG